MVDRCRQMLARRSPSVDRFNLLTVPTRDRGFLGTQRLRETRAVSHARLLTPTAARNRLRFRLYARYTKMWTLVSSACGSGRVCCRVKTRPLPQALLT